jgi:hypothetical protein
MGQEGEKEKKPVKAFQDSGNTKEPGVIYFYTLLNLHSGYYGSVVGFQIPGKRKPRYRCHYLEFTLFGHTEHTFPDKGAKGGLFAVRKNCCKYKYFHVV